MFKHLLLTFFVTAPLFAHGHNPKAHTHGKGALTLVDDDKRLIVEFEIPLADILGFEHMGKNDAEKAAITKAEDTFSKVEGIISFNTEAQCTLTGKKIVLFEKCNCPKDTDTSTSVQTSAQTSVLTSTKTTQTSKTTAHKHESHEQHMDEHADAKISYHFSCAKMPLLKQARLPIFTTFPKIKSLSSSFVISTRQGKKTLDSVNSILKLAK